MSAGCTFEQERVFSKYEIVQQFGNTGNPVWGQCLQLLKVQDQSAEASNIASRIKLGDQTYQVSKVAARRTNLTVSSGFDADFVNTNAYLYIISRTDGGKGGCSITTSNIAKEKLIYQAMVDPSMDAQKLCTELLGN
jgi:hypothetical protein